MPAVGSLKKYWYWAGLLALGALIAAAALVAPGKISRLELEREAQLAADRLKTKLLQEPEALFRAWYVPFYEYGVIHGDPHLGNYAARPDHAVNLLDFGCIRVFPPRFVHGVIELYFALRDDEPERAVEAYRIWGFADLRREVIDVLNIWARFVYAPLMKDRVQGIQEENDTRYGARVAGKVHEELRRIGSVKPPREFVLMDRAAIGLGSVFMRLKAEINWYRLFHDMIGDFDVAALARRQAAALKKVGLASPPD